MDKQGIRERMRSMGALDREISDRVVSGLFDWMSPRLPGTVSAFLAMSGEVDLRSLFERLPGWRWVLPRVEPDGSLSFRDRDVPRETHRFGMEQPVDAGPIIPIHQIDVLLTPGLAFDREGGRLGNGGGFYDRVLAGRRTDSHAIGVTVTDRVIAEVPMLEHDQRVDWIATEDGVIRCKTKR